MVWKETRCEPITSVWMYGLHTNARQWTVKARQEVKEDAFCGLQLDVEFNENYFCQQQGMTTKLVQKGEEVKQNAVTTRENEEVAEMKKIEEDMPQEPRQSEKTQKAPVTYGFDEYADAQPTVCTMLPIIYVRLMNPQLYKKQSQVTKL